MIRRNNIFLKFYNNSYNFIFKKMNNIKIDKYETKNCIRENIQNINHSTVLQTGWLLNLKKLYDLTKKKIDISNYHFLDVGCGNGIPLIYAYKNFIFKSYSGFDFVSNYVDNSKKNILTSLKNNEIIVFNADASKYILEDKSYFIFMFNPFDRFIMKKFLQNNYSNFVKNKSVIAYSNSCELETFKKFTNNIQVIDQYKLAVCFF